MRFKYIYKTYSSSTNRTTLSQQNILSVGLLYHLSSHCHLRSSLGVLGLIFQLVPTIALNVIRKMFPRELILFEYLACFYHWLLFGLTFAS